MDYKAELKNFFGENCLLDEPMARHTTYRTGGKAEVYVYPQTREEWSFVLKLAQTQNIPLRIIGFGSNILVSGKGIGGITCSTKRMNHVSVDGEHVKAEAGAALDKACELACEAGLAGMEKLSGIPGSIGGAVYMNAGAFGREMAELITRVDAVTADGEVVAFSPQALEAGYRHTCIAENGLTVLGAELALTPSSEREIRTCISEYRERREKSQPKGRSLGSVFKRVDGISAGYYIDRAGLKGVKKGGAEISDKHANFIINGGGATGADFLYLAELAKKRVYEIFGISLEYEVVFL